MKIYRRGSKSPVPRSREQFEEYLSETVKEISRELEKSGYAEIEYRYDETAIREELLEREHLYEKDGTRALERNLNFVTGQNLKMRFTKKIF